jgi:hypothetical protein
MSKLVVILAHALMLTIPQDSHGGSSTCTVLVPSTIISAQELIAGSVGAPQDASYIKTETGDNKSSGLPNANFLVDVLAFLTTILLAISGYTVYRSHRDAAEAKHELKKIITNAEMTLKEANTASETCTGIKNTLSTKHDEIMSEIPKRKEIFDGDLKKLLDQFTEKMEAELKVFRAQIYESSTISRSKVRLLELLVDDNVSPDAVFPLLTEILNYPDQRSIAIFERVLEVFPNDIEMMAKVKSGLRTYCERGDLRA